MQDEIQKLVNSNVIYDKTIEIGKKNDLNIDQTGQLNSNIEMMLLGETKSSDFLSIIIKSLDIDNNKAKKIAEDVNEKIVLNVRQMLREMQEKAEKEAGDTQIQDGEYISITDSSNLSNTHIEQAGKFTIENNPQSSSPQYKENNISKEETLKQIEDTPIPFVDHLLANPVSNPQTIEQRIVDSNIVKTTSVPTKAESKPYTADPYREQI